MRALVVYESMYGNTHLVAEAIARGLRSACPVQVASLAEARVRERPPLRPRRGRRPDTRARHESAPDAAKRDNRAQARV